MPKLPSLQFFPGDWLRDPVAGCSLASQGLWLRLLILAHDSERYGYLCQNGLPIPPEQLARRCGCSLDEFNALLAELDSAGVPSRLQDFTIYSRRMVRDAEDRAAAAARQRKSRGSASRLSHGAVTAASQKRHSATADSDENGRYVSITPPLKSSSKTKRRRSPLLVPSLEEVKSYCAERNNQVDPHEFVDYYTANGWVQGNNRKPIRDWKAAVRTWERHSFSRGVNGGDPRGTLSAMSEFKRKYGNNPIVKDQE